MFLDVTTHLEHGVLSFEKEIEGKSIVRNTRSNEGMYVGGTKWAMAPPLLEPRR
jgi:hypothetical protein